MEGCDTVSVNVCLPLRFVCVLSMCIAVILTCKVKRLFVLVFFKITVTCYFGGAPGLALG